MMKFGVLFGFLAIGCITAKVPTRNERSFPDDFLFGTAIAAYQGEGGWNEDGKGESIWDHLTHTNPSYIIDFSNGDVASDSYHNYRRDVEMMREVGLDAYRFSIAWSRVLPTGFTDEINEEGIAYYNNFINEMLTYNITPIIAMYHWDLPQRLQEFGGFANPLIADWFEDYARLNFERFGDRVKHWITFNEPREICYEGYGLDTKAPILNATGRGEYICAKNIVTAHAKAYHVYNNEFRSTQGGTIGITISVNWFGPLTDSEEDEFAAELRRQAEWGMYAEPIFSKEGGFPKELSERVAEKSRQQGYLTSRMPEFTEEEKAFVRGTSDFFAVNHYSSSLVSATQYIPDSPVPSLENDLSGGTYRPEDWPQSASSWLVQAPNSIYNALTHLRNRYDDPIFYITENGWSTVVRDDDFNDDDRIRYHRAALESTLDAMEAGVIIRGYMAWSLLDNFEWNNGYTQRFGFYSVDFEDPARTRTPRKSAFFYKQIIRTRVIDHDYEPDTMIMTIDEGH